MHCPECDSHNIIKSGINATEKQNRKCNFCGRQFVLDPMKSRISDDTKGLIDRLLLERISLAGIAGVSERWLQTYVNQKYENVQRAVSVKKREGRQPSDRMWRTVVVFLK